jgi:hypothetical protein
VKKTTSTTVVYEFPLMEVLYKLGLRIETARNGTSVSVTAGQSVLRVEVMTETEETLDIPSSGS